MKAYYSTFTTNIPLYYCFVNPSFSQSHGCIDGVEHIEADKGCSIFKGHDIHRQCHQKEDLSRKEGRNQAITLPRKNEKNLA